MAFSQEDCDTLYDKQILPALKSLNISPIRVDRKEHKDDLNNYIIRMLNESDIALADLTYARPSVYYEAGYAERKIPVVYTAREDHLSRVQQEDGLRVHFDLEMKKIIAWQDPNDETFTKRLKRRINYFICPMKKQRRRNELLEKGRHVFISSSVTDRLGKIRKEFQGKLKTKRFWVSSLRNVDKALGNILWPARVFIGVKMVGKICYLCAVIITDSLTKKQIQHTVNYLTGYLLVSYDEKIDEYEEHYYFCSLRKVPESRLTSALPDAVASDSPGTFSWYPRTFLEIKSKKYIKLISPINSPIQLKEDIKGCVSVLPNEKTNPYTYLTSTQEPFYKGFKIKFSEKPSHKKSEKQS